MLNWKRPSRLIRNGLTSLFLGTLLAACSPKVVVKSQPVSPPSQYYDGECRITPYIITNNASMASAIRSLIVDIQVCSADRKAIQAWKEELNG